MKKTLTRIGFFTALIVAIASYGGNMLTAHAQSLTPTQASALEQQLDVAKAQLVQLQMQSGMVPAGDSDVPASVMPTVTVAPAAPTTMLSASDITAMNTALGALANVLTGIESKIATDPQFVSANGPTLAATLQTIGNTIVAIGDEANAPQTSGNIGTGASIAATKPTPAPTPTTAQTAPTQNSAPVATANPAPAAATTPTTPAPTAANTAPQTAQASSAFSFSNLNWPVIIVIVLIIVALAIWLWWDDSDETKAKPVVVKNIPSQPAQQPAQPIQTMNQQINVSANPATPTTPAQSPLSSAMGSQQKKTA